MNVQKINYQKELDKILKRLEDVLLLDEPTNHLDAEMSRLF